MADGPAASEPARNPPVVSELERDNGPHDADAGSCPARPARRSFLRGALGAGVTGAVTGVVAGAAAGAGAGYAYRSSQAAAPGQVLDAEMLAGLAAGGPVPRAAPGGHPAQAAAADGHALVQRDR